MSWADKQTCPDCGWEGLTAQQYVAAGSFVSFIAAVVIVSLVEVNPFPPDNPVQTYSIAILGMLWFYGLPALVLRWNACPRCETRFRIGAGKKLKKTKEPAPGPDDAG